MAKFQREVCTFSSQQNESFLSLIEHRLIWSFVFWYFHQETGKGNNGLSLKPTKSTPIEICPTVSTANSNYGDAGGNNSLNNSVDIFPKSSRTYFSYLSERRYKFRFYVKYSASFHIFRINLRDGPIFSGVNAQKYSFVQLTLCKKHMLGLPSK